MLVWLAWRGLASLVLGLFLGAFSLAWLAWFPCLLAWLAWFALLACLIGSLACLLGTFVWLACSSCLACWLGVFALLACPGVRACRGVLACLGSLACLLGLLDSAWFARSTWLGWLGWLGLLVWRACLACLPGLFACLACVAWPGLARLGVLAVCLRGGLGTRVQGRCQLPSWSGCFISDVFVLLSMGRISTACIHNDNLVQGLRVTTKRNN